jgi:hypothetical protein
MVARAWFAGLLGGALLAFAMSGCYLSPEGLAALRDGWPWFRGAVEDAGSPSLARDAQAWEADLEAGDVDALRRSLRAGTWGDMTSAVVADMERRGDVVGRRRAEEYDETTRRVLR